MKKNYERITVTREQVKQLSIFNDLILFQLANSDLGKNRTAIERGRDNLSRIYAGMDSDAKSLTLEVCFLNLNDEIICIINNPKVVGMH